MLTKIMEKPVSLVRNKNQLVLKKLRLIEDVVLPLTLCQNTATSGGKQGRQRHWSNTAQKIKTGLVGGFVISDMSYVLYRLPAKEDSGLVACPRGYISLGNGPSLLPFSPNFLLLL